MAPVSDEQNRKIRDERREQILKAALRVFARYGLSAAKIGTIAKAAGLSHGLVYHYFSSKDEIYTALLERALATAAETNDAVYDYPGTPLEKLHQMTSFILQASDASFFLLVLQAFTTEGVPEQAKELLIRYSPLTLIEKLVPLIQAGQRIGEIVRGDPRQLAMAYHSALQGAFLVSLQGDNLPRVDADSIIRILKA